MKIMVAFLGKKKNKRNDYLKEIKNIHKNKLLSNNKISYKNNKSLNNIFNQNDNKFSIDKIYDTYDKNEKSKEKKYIGYFETIKKRASKIKEDDSYYTSLKLTAIFCITIIFLIIKLPNLEVFLTKFATNLRQADKDNVEFANIVSTMSLFNKDNYIMSKNNTKIDNDYIDINEVAKEEIKEYKIIDDEVKKYDLEQVFSNSNIDVKVNSQTATLQKVSVNDIWILNYSSNRSIDFKSILEKDINLTKKSDKILLYNTHTSESYTNSENYKFEYSSVMRSQDARYNMLAIAKELNDNLLKKGFESIQDTTPHDYGAYTGAYMKSRESVTNDLIKLNGAGIIMDVHRDAMEDLTFRPVANINGVQVSQIMFVIGIGTGENKYWEDNLRLALKLQNIANRVYPGLCRQMIIRDSTYNQDLNKYSILVEFGATGNTIDEVKLSTRCLANLLNIIYKD